jgi:hypothetical protein
MHKRWVQKWLLPILSEASTDIMACFPDLGDGALAARTRLGELGASFRYKVERVILKQRGR